MPSAVFSAIIRSVTVLLLSIKSSMISSLNPIELSTALDWALACEAIIKHKAKPSSSNAFLAPFILSLTSCCGANKLAYWFRSSLSEIFCMQDSLSNSAFITNFFPSILKNSIQETAENNLSSA